MSSRASLNHFYRTVWNHALGCAVAVAENASSGGGRASGSAQAVVFPHQPVARLALLSLAVALGWGLTGVARANPTGGVAVVGQATFDYTQPNKLLVTTQNGAGTNYSAINWQSFSIPAGSTTRIEQPNANSMSINRVVTNTPTTLFGTLSSNGKIVLVNQSGIAVGQGAVVDTGGFTASTLAMSDADARAGRQRFAAAGSAAGTLNVQGQVIGRSGDVVLVAPNVEVAKSAVVEAPNGAVVLAAGQNVDVTGRGLEGIRLNVQAPQDQALNLGTLKGDAVGIFAGTLKHSGAISANQASVDGGRVVLKASGDAFIEGNGQISALRADALGGIVNVLGNRVALTDNARIDVSAAKGSGTVLVGGDAHGANPDVANAQMAFVGPNASINADATEQGNGGKVVVWADEATQFKGRISARGGAQGGDGGWVETSGKQVLGFSGLVDTTAEKGATGSLLLDPANIEISSFTDSPTLNWDNPSKTFSFPSATLPPAYLNSGTLATQLSLSNVTVDANAGTAGAGNITVNSAVSWSSGNTLKLNTASGGGITINAALDGGTSGVLALSAGTGGITKDTAPVAYLKADQLEIISTGNVSLTGGNGVRVNTLAGNVTGTATIESYTPGSALTIGTVGSTTGLTSSGPLTLYEYSTGANINVNANVSGGTGVTKIGQATTSGTVTIASGKTVSGFDTEVYAAGGVTVNGTMSGSNSATLHTGLGSGSITTGSGGIVSAPTVTLMNDPQVGLGSIGSSASPLRTSGTNVYLGASGYGPSGVYIKHTGTLHLKTANIQIGAPVQLEASGDVALYADIQTESFGNAAVLAAGGNFTDNGHVINSANGRWLVFSTQPSSNSLTATGGGAIKVDYAFSQYGTSYGGSIQGSGNGLIYSTSPTLVVTTPTALDKVYDGLASSTVTTSSLGLNGFQNSNVNGSGADTLTSTEVTANYPSRNVGTNLAVTFSGVNAQDSGGKPVYGYSIPNGTATISQRPLSTWTGAFNNQWSNPLNWDALPDANNVLAVFIPAGTSVVFDSAVVPTTLKTVTSASPIAVAGSSLQVSDGFTAAGFGQTGGLLSGKGVFNVNGVFNQTAGKLDWGNVIAVITPSGNIVFNDLKAPGVSLTATAGSVTGTGGVVTDALTVVSGTGAVMNSVDNRIKTFKATNTGPGNIELTNVGALTVLGIHNTAGGIVMNNTGGITTTGPVTAPSAVGISLTANSPLTIGADGVSSGGNVVLTATNLTSAGNVTLNGPITSTGGTVALNAANNMTQNAVVYGAKGVSAKVGGTLTLTSAAKSGAAPVSYLVGGSSVTPPPSTEVPTPVDRVPVPTEGTGVFDRVQDAIAQTNLLTTFLDKFELALKQPSDDPNDKDRNRRGLVVEGDVCSR